MRGVISNAVRDLEVRNLQNDKNDNLNGEALDEVKCTQIYPVKLMIDYRQGIRVRRCLAAKPAAILDLRS